MGPVLRRGAVLLLGLCSAEATAAGDYDHHGSVGLLGGSGLLLKQSSGSVSGPRDTGTRTPIDLGGSVAVGESGNEIVLLGRLELGGPVKVYSVYGGYRSYAGRGQLKPFFDLNLAVQVRPGLAVGPRLGFGIQYELAKHLGLSLSTGAQGAFGSSLSYSVDLLLGLQIRSYLFQ